MTKWTLGDWEANAYVKRKAKKGDKVCLKALFLTKTNLIAKMKVFVKMKYIKTYNDLKEAFPDMPFDKVKMLIEQNNYDPSFFEPAIDMLMENHYDRFLAEAFVTAVYPF